MKRKILGNNERGLLFVISGPAGTGKTTLVEMMMKEFPEEIAESCSYTTRQPRRGEVAKQHYEFITYKEFEEKIKHHEFLEYANVFGDYYGTPKDIIFTLLEAGKHVILVIDTQGALQLRKVIPVISIFIAPPSFEELSNRLFKRQTENEEEISKRLVWAKEEMSVASKYDYLIVNDSIEETYQVLRSIFIAEEHKRR